MRAVPRLALLLGVLALAAAAPPLPDGPAAERAQNRRLLERYRADPTHYERLRRNLRWFQALPAARQAALRKLDHDLREEDPVIQARLFRVMDRYATWLERLPAADRQRVQAAPTAAERLQVVKELREREWVARLPLARQQELERAAPEKRAELLDSFRRQERARRLEWESVLADGVEPPLRAPPLRLTDLPPLVQVYVNTSFSEEERDRLKNLQGEWPAFGRALLESAARHPVTLPGPANGPRRPKDLPVAVREKLKPLPRQEHQRLRAVEGRWPDYAIAVTRAVRGRSGGVMPEELGPCRADKMPSAVKSFLEKRLLRVLTEKEKQRLAAAEGRWPDYPRAILDLARAHRLAVPGLLPPGPRGFWVSLRNAVAESARAPSS